jgi:hypothetical protein
MKSFQKEILNPDSDSKNYNHYPIQSENDSKGSNAISVCRSFCTPTLYNFHSIDSEITRAEFKRRIDHIEETNEIWESDYRLKFGINSDDFIIGVALPVLTNHFSEYEQIGSFDYLKSYSDVDEIYEFQTKINDDQMRNKGELITEAKIGATMLLSSDILRSKGFLGLLMESQTPHLFDGTIELKKCSEISNLIEKVRDKSDNLVWPFDTPCFYSYANSKVIGSNN